MVWHGSIHTARPHTTRFLEEIGMRRAPQVQGVSLLRFTITRPVPCVVKRTITALSSRAWGSGVQVIAARSCIRRDASCVSGFVLVCGCGCSYGCCPGHCGCCGGWCCGCGGRRCWRWGWHVFAHVAVGGPAAGTRASLAGQARDAAAFLAGARVGTQSVLVGTADSIWDGGALESVGGPAAGTRAPLAGRARDAAA